LIWGLGRGRGSPGGSEPGFSKRVGLSHGRVVVNARRGRVGAYAACDRKLACTKRGYRQKPIPRAAQHASSPLSPHTPFLASRVRRGALDHPRALKCAARCWHADTVRPSRPVITRRLPPAWAAVPHHTSKGSRGGKLRAKGGIKKSCFSPSLGAAWVPAAAFPDCACGCRVCRAQDKHAAPEPCPAATRQQPPLPCGLRTRALSQPRPTRLALGFVARADKATV